MFTIVNPIPARYTALSGDAKPSAGIPTGANLEETDTNKEYRFDGFEWVEKPSVKKILTEIYDEMSQYPHDLDITVGAGTTLTVKRTVLGGAVADDTTFSGSGIVYNRDVLEITVLPEGSIVTVNGVLLEGTGYMVGTGADFLIVSAVGEGG